MEEEKGEQKHSWLQQRSSPRFEPEMLKSWVSWTTSSLHCVTDSGDAHCFVVVRHKRIPALTAKSQTPTLTDNKLII